MSLSLRVVIASFFVFATYGRCRGGGGGGGGCGRCSGGGLPDLRGSSGGSRRGRCSPRLGGLGLGGLGLGGLLGGLALAAVPRT